jgi:hypothetical protein
MLANISYYVLKTYVETITEKLNLGYFLKFL